MWLQGILLKKCWAKNKNSYIYEYVLIGSFLQFLVNFFKPLDVIHSSFNLVMFVYAKPLFDINFKQIKS